MSGKVLNIVVIGLGHQSLEDHLPAIQESKKYNLVGVIDIDEENAEKIAKEYQTISAQTYSELKSKIIIKIDVALVAVPHSKYLKIIKEVAADKIDIIKEKPFAISLKEASDLKDIVEENNISLFVTLQRRYNPIFKSFEQLVKRIGKIYAIEARYTMNIADLSSGWRAVKDVAYGGALADMGYHYIDLLVWYFGLPDSMTCKISTGNRKNQSYDVEDTAFVDFSYNDIANDNERVLGNLVVSRVYPEKDEYLVAYGSDGSVSVKRGELVRLDVAGQEVEHLSRLGGWPSAIIDQLEDFHKKIISGEYKGKIIDEYMKQVSFLEASYVSAKTHKAENPINYFNELKKG